MDATAQQQSAPKWGAHVDVEAKPGSRRSLGEADLFLPLTQSERSLVFASLRGRFDDHDGHEGNVGAGMRRMLDSGWNLGGYAYVDRRRSETGNRFSQATLGAEALGRDWDFRGNLYQPFGDQVKNTGTQSSTASLTGTTVQVVTRPFEERALEGYDMEAGWRVPLWTAEADTQLRIYAGGFRFSDSMTKISGPRVRAELAMYDLQSLWQGAQLMLGAEYQDDNARGSQGFVSLRLRIPFGSGKTPKRKLNWQEQRMAAPVVRDVDIVTRTVVSAHPGIVETATATASGQTLTVLDSGTTTGAALPGAVTAAGTNSTVVLSGTYSTTATTTLQNGQTLMGAGTLTVRTPSGYTAQLTLPGATINADIPGGGATVTMASNSTLSGMTVSHHSTTNQSAQAVRASGVSNVLITNNTISASSGGGALAAQGVLVGAGSTNATVSNNTIHVSTASNLQNLVGINGSLGSFGTITISGNNVTITGTATIKYGIGTAGGVPGGTIATITGNTLNVTGGGGTNNAVDAINTEIAAGSTGNVRTAGGCSYRIGTTGTIGFTDGTPCP